MGAYNGCVDIRHRCFALKILHVIGARPNYMKVAPIYAELAARSGVQQLLVHTGQHYSPEMSTLFFDDLGMPQPDVNLGVGSGSHAVQTARVIEAFEPVLLEFNPDVVLVVGDVNSTVESGLRSFDMEMPEEINRILTDRISDILFTTEDSGSQNLLKEGTDESRIQFVGNTMIDSLVAHRDKASGLNTVNKHGHEDGTYLLGTIHRPSNVDEQSSLTEIVDTLVQAAQRLPLLLPLHPRTQGNLEKFGMLEAIQTNSNITITGPLGYLDFLRCQMGARVVLTDSGGIQEETSFLGVPCLTMRENTERPVTLSHGTNRLVGTNGKDIIAALDSVLESPAPSAPQIPLWDGRAAERISDVLLANY